MNNTIKVTFKSVRAAIAASVDGSATAGKRSPSGRITSWIAAVAKASPYETSQEAAARIAG